MKLRIVALLACAAAFMAAAAQDSYFIIKEQAMLHHDDIALGKRAATTFLSNRMDLVVQSSNAKDEIQSAVKTPEGQWAYKVVCDLQDGGGSDRRFSVYQRGTAMKGEQKVVLETGRNLYYTVELFDHQIHINNQTTTAVFPEAGKACIEVSTPIDNMQVRVSAELSPEIRRSVSVSGAFVVSIIIDANKLAQFRERAGSTEQAYKKQLARLESMTGDVPDSEYDRLDQLQEEMNAAVSLWTSVLYMSLCGEGTNEAIIPAESIEGLGPKGKLLFGIIELPRDGGTDEVTQMLVMANRSVDQRRYKEAMDLYAKAASMDGVDADRRRQYTAYAQTLQEYSNLKAEAKKGFDVLKALKQGKVQVPVETVEECYHLIINNYSALYSKTNDKFYREQADAVQEKFNNLPVIVEGYTETTDFKQGQLKTDYVGGVAVYGVKAFHAGRLNKNKAKEMAARGTRLGVSESNGHFKLEVKRNAYTHLLFVHPSLGGHLESLSASHTKLVVKFTKD